MTRAGQIIALLRETPGMTMRQVHAALGGDYSYNAVGAQLSTMAQAGKLRRSPNCTRGGSYWVTEFAGTDMRKSPLRAARRRLAAKAAAATRLHGPKPAAPTAVPKPETRSVMRARVRAERVTFKPVKQVRERIIQPPRPQIRQVTGRVQTVDEFLRNGGQIQVLKQHECAYPLQFDHSQTNVPIHNRRPSTRMRPAPGR